MNTITIKDIPTGIESKFTIGATLDKPTRVLEVKTSTGIVKLELTARELRLLAVDLLIN